MQRYFDDIWEEIHKEKEWGKYPPEELVRYILGTYKSLRPKERKNIKILELGCGQGANICFMAREGFDVYGIDGSESAIKKAEERLKLENLNASLVVGDFTDLSCFDSHEFDVIIDIASLQCNRLNNVRHTLEQCQNKLKPEGTIFCMMIASGSLGDGMGKMLEKNTYTDIEEGPLKGTGTAHFFDINEIPDVFKPFGHVHIEYSTRSLNGMKHWIKHWIVTGKKSK